MTNDEIVVDVLNASYLLKELPNEKDDSQEKNQLLIHGKLTIPEYQRPYCWGEKQISSLIRDLEKHQEHDRNLRYYLGSIILHKQDGALNIIDGQQRVTTLALMMHVLGIDINTSLSYASPISQMNIHKNIKWLKSNIEKLKKVVFFENIELSVVMTKSEDDAYRFFETQNTGGVRLSGADIIKAHHLRALKETHRGRYAKQWEKLGDINPIILTLLRGRFWQKLKYRDLPSHREVKTLREAIVDEFAEKTGTGTDTAFARTRRISDETGHFYQEHSHNSYDFRQPLNAGLNSINYLTYFQSLRIKYIECSEIPHLTDEEVNALTQMGVLSEKMQLSSNLATGMLENGKMLTPLEKLLYAVLWKNGDLGKENHLISGIQGKEHQQKFGTVFYEFGGYLSGKNNYILDQHTLRCFAVYESSEETIASARTLELIDGTNKKHISWMESYKEFYEDICINIDCDKSDFLYFVDRLLFGAGKLIKLSKKRK